MPKLAATLASLLLIACSIGVNIARYPQVGRALDPPCAATAEPANLSPAASQTPPVETTDKADLTPVKPEVAAPVAEEAKPAAGERESRAVSAAAPSAPPAQTDLTVPIVDVRPMAPAGRQANGGGSPAGDGEVRRLPAVESNGFAAADTDSHCGCLGSVSHDRYALKTANHEIHERKKSSISCISWFLFPSIHELGTASAASCWQTSRPRSRAFWAFRQA